ncbi:MAG: MFS transporter [Wenzhouxiangellaceae bacterium]|nr:MFS transporter [Wenzhouxiangellaceae bacterium]
MKQIRIVVALVLAYMIFAMLLNSVGTVILQSITSYGVTKTQAGTLEGFKDIPIALASFLLASLIPRLGYRRGIMLGLGLVAAACVAMALADSFWMTRLLFLVTGASFGIVKVSVYSSIGLLTHDRQSHAALTNLIEGLFMVGVLAGYWLFGAFIDDANPGSDSWLQVYWVLAAICLLAIALLSVSRLDESGTVVVGETIGQGFGRMLSLAIRPMVLVFIISAWLYVLIEQSIGTWLPTFNSEVLKLPNAMSVQMASIFAAALAIGRLSAGALLRLLPWHALLNLCVIAMGVLVVLTLPLASGIEAGEVTGWSSAPLAAWLFPLIGLFMAPIYPAINSVMLSALPRHQHALMTGLIVIASALGGTTGSMLTGVLFGRLGGETAFYMSLVPMAAILVSLRVFKHESDRMVLAAE